MSYTHKGSEIIERETGKQIAVVLPTNCSKRDAPIPCSPTIHHYPDGPKPAMREDSENGEWYHKDDYKRLSDELERVRKDAKARVEIVLMHLNGDISKSPAEELRGRIKVARDLLTADLPTWLGAIARTGDKG